jgi:hypothetical protein
LAVQVPTPATVDEHVAGWWLRLSSAEPSQSSSTPLQVSAAGVRAVHPTQPRVVSQVSVPKQVPLALLREHGRLWPWLLGRHEHVPEVGAHWFGPPANAVQVKPASQTPAGLPWRLPAEQSRPQTRSEPSVRQRSPGVRQSASVAQAEQVASTTGAHEVAEAR